MYLPIATTHPPATDLGFLMRKYSGQAHETQLWFGRRTSYPEVYDVRCEAALMLHIDPVAPVRGNGRADGLVDQCANDRPYV